jgi:uncharacterized integral membrane protein
MNGRLIAILVTLLLLMLFTLQNTETVGVRILFWRFSFPLAALVFLVLLIGVGAGWTLHGLWRRRSRRRSAAQRGA